MGQTVLIVEDDKDIVELLRLYLSGSGYEVLSAPDGMAALEVVANHPVDIALVDLMMPRMNGYGFVKELRKRSDVPILMVSARSQSADKIVALDAGADGYITKPFDPLEVTAYIRALLRRAEDQSSDEARTAETPATARVRSIGELSLDLDHLVLTKRGETIPLTAAELRIMAAFMAEPGRVFSKAQLHAQVSGDNFGGEGSVMVHISNIRTKLEDDPLHPSHIVTVRGMGYRLQ